MLGVPGAFCFFVSVFLSGGLIMPTPALMNGRLTKLGLQQLIDGIRTRPWSKYAGEPLHKVVPETVAKHFPTAIPIAELVQRVTTRLRDSTDGTGFHPSRTLVSFSICADELNRSLEAAFARPFGELYHFNMGGLMGFPFTGMTGFGAMTSHIPDGGDCLFVYGPHMGIDQLGVAGRVDRVGMASPSACCGSGVVATQFILDNIDDLDKAEKQLIRQVDREHMEAQQFLVELELLPYAHRLRKAEDVNVELAQVAYKLIDDRLLQIIARGVGKYPGRMALVGGIQINTPPTASDYFVPLRFDLLNARGETIEKLLWEE